MNLYIDSIPKRKNELSVNAPLAEELTRKQKEAIVWVDLAAGAASAAAGPGSFLVAALASAAYYADKKANSGWPIIEPNPVITYPISVSSSTAGELHNAICVASMVSGDPVTYWNLIASANLVDTVLTVGIDSAFEVTANAAINTATTTDFSTVANQKTFLVNLFSIGISDATSLESSLTTIHNSSEANMATDIQLLIDDIPNYSLSLADKTILINCFDILKHSRTVLWNY